MTRDEYIRRLVDAAPPLTPAQRDRLAVLLAPGITAMREREQGRKQPDQPASDAA